MRYGRKGRDDMSPYTGKDRIRAAFRREFADRVPYYPQLGHFNAQLLPCSIREFLTESEKFAEAQIKAYEMFKFDVVLVLADLMMEAEDLGTKVRYPEDSLCLITEPLIKEKSLLNTLDVPDPLSSRRMSYFIEACKKVCREVK
ncbi:MAG: uroporphyrinogen decarboxylase family protein, partial [Candidatus Bathyarchaeia archaeon]